MLQESSDADMRRGLHKARMANVFISSTFQGMAWERDELVSFVFPELRKRCQELNVVLNDYDLRWGITEDQVAREELLEACFRAIERCRFFVGILGNRYGTCVERFSSSLLARYSWLPQYAHRSITELEVLVGVLRSAPLQRRAFFYFREDGQEKSPSPPPGSDSALLLQLKDQIRRCGACVRSYRSGDDDFGRTVLEDLKASIEEEFPLRGPSDPMREEARQHHFYALAKAADHVRRKSDFESISGYVMEQGDSPGLLVTGEVGVGKTAFLADWFLQFSARNPEYVWCTHFVRATPGSGSVPTMLRRFICSLQPLLPRGEAIPAEPEKIVDGFIRYLHRAAESTRIIVLLDGVDRLDSEGVWSSHRWLGSRFPAGLKVVVSANAGPLERSLTRSGWRAIQLGHLSLADRQEHASAYLACFGKQLTEPRLLLLTGSSLAGNALFLSLALEAIRALGSHEEVDEWLGRYRECMSIEELFALVLATWEAHYEKRTQGLVGSILSLIAASRSGTAEEELMELLRGSGLVISRFDLDAVLNAAGHVLHRNHERVLLSHSILGQTIQTRYGRLWVERHGPHGMLASHFAHASLDLRVATTPRPKCRNGS